MFRTGRGLEKKEKVRDWHGLVGGNVGKLSYFSLILKYISGLLSLEESKGRGVRDTCFKETYRNLTINLTNTHTQRHTHLYISIVAHPLPPYDASEEVLCNSLILLHLYSLLISLNHSFYSLDLDSFH